MLQGIDLSCWSTPVNWTTLKDNDYVFGINKSSQGNFADSKYKIHRENGARNGIPQGAYHFYDQRYSVQAQVTAMAAVVGEEFEIPPALDFEPKEIKRLHGTPVPSRTACLDAIQEFFELADAIFGVPTMFYSNPDHLLNVLKNNIPSWLTKRLLWIAQYGYIPSPAFVPYIKPWTKWTFHQWTGDTVHLPGAREVVDINNFNGSMSDLLGLIDYRIDDAPISGYAVKITTPLGLRIREYPNTSSKRLGLIPFGKMAIVEEEQDGWGLAQYGLFRGWISLNWTKRV